MITIAALRVLDWLIHRLPLGHDRWGDSRADDLCDRIVAAKFLHLDRLHRLARMSWPQRTTAPVGWHCEHMTITAGGGYITRPFTSWCGCKPTPLYGEAGNRGIAA